jgi:transcriptional regulator with XRE-family HTH domain
MKVQESVQMKYQTNIIVQKCVHLRKDNKYTILELSKVLEIDRRKISDFEKGKFNLDLAYYILSYFGYDLLIWECLSNS